MIQIGVATKQMFFDRKRVMSGVDRQTRQVFNRLGALTRKIAKQSIRYRKAVSLPGDPPSCHGKGRWGLRGLIYYGYEPTRRTVVIGPVRFADGGADLLEYGGTRRVVRRRRGKRQRVRQQYKARPFMGPAMEEAKPKLPALWAESVR